MDNKHRGQEWSRPLYYDGPWDPYQTRDGWEFISPVDEEVMGPFRTLDEALEGLMAESRKLK